MNHCTPALASLDISLPPSDRILHLDPYASKRGYRFRVDWARLLWEADCGNRDLARDVYSSVGVFEDCQHQRQAEGGPQ